MALWSLLSLAGSCVLALIAVVVSRKTLRTLYGSVSRRVWLTLLGFALLSVVLRLLLDLRGVTRQDDFFVLERSIHGFLDAARFERGMMSAVLARLVSTVLPVSALAATTAINMAMSALLCLPVFGVVVLHVRRPAHALVAAAIVACHPFLLVQGSVADYHVPGILLAAGAFWALAAALRGGGLGLPLLAASLAGLSVGAGAEITPLLGLAFLLLVFRPRSAGPGSGWLAAAVACGSFAVLALPAVIKLLTVAAEAQGIEACQTMIGVGSSAGSLPGGCVESWWGTMAGQIAAAWAALFVDLDLAPLVSIAGLLGVWRLFAGGRRLTALALSAFLVLLVVLYFGTHLASPAAHRHQFVWPAVVLSTLAGIGLAPSLLDARGRPRTVRLLVGAAVLVASVAFGVRDARRTLDNDPLWRSTHAIAGWSGHIDSDDVVCTDDAVSLRPLVARRELASCGPGADWVLLEGPFHDSIQEHTDGAPAPATLEARLEATRSLVEGTGLRFVRREIASMPDGQAVAACVELASAAPQRP